MLRSTLLHRNSAPARANWLSLRVCLLLIPSCALLATSLTAQTQTGAVAGRAIDASGDGLPGVLVTLSGPALMGERTAVTLEDGLFRFPSLAPGEDYELVFDMDGFSRVIRQGLRVQIGTTAAVDVTLQLSEVEDEITVTGESPLIDTSSATVAMNHGIELLENIPNTRRFQDAVSQSAGLVDDAYTGVSVGQTWSAKGGAATSNEIAFDGVASTSPVYHASAQEVVYEAVDEVQVVTGGLPAELGNVGGAYVNVVTKSGGNTFHGSAAAFYQDDGLQSDNLSDDLIERGLESSDEIIDYDDYSFNLGGPIVRDKLWWNVAYRKFDTQDNRPGFPIPDEFERDYYFGKVTLQPNQRNNIFVMYNRNENEWAHQPPTAFYTPEAAWFNPSTTEVAKAKWTSALTDRVLLELDISTAKTDSSLLPQTDSGEAYLDLLTNVWSGGAFIYQRNRTERDQAKLALPWYVDGVAGNHQFKAGVELEKSNWYGDNFKETPVLYHLTLGGAPLLAVFSNYPSQTNSEGDGLHGYLQDTWDVSSRLTLNLGVRLNTWQGSYPAQGNAGFSYGPFVDFAPVSIGDTEILDWTSFEPRIAATWSLTESGTSVLRLALGRYHHALYFGYMILGNPNALAFTIHPWLDLNADLFANQNEVFGAISGGGGASASIEPGTNNPYTDEIVLGYQTELFDNISLSVNATYREDKDSIDITKPGAGPESYVPIEVADPGIDGVAGTGDDQTLTLFNQIDNFLAPQVITNVPQAEREYKGVEAIVQRRYDGNWQALASLTWQDSEGTIGTDFNSSLGWSGAFEDPNNLINLEGPLSLNREWQAKLMGTYVAPWDVSISGYFLYQSGLPIYRSLTTVLNQGAVAVVADPRDTHELDDQNRLDLRIEKKFQLADRLGVDLSVDVFNVFNENAVTTANGGTVAGGGFLRPLTIQPSRTMRFGARMRW